VGGFFSELLKAALEALANGDTLLAEASFEQELAATRHQCGQPGGGAG
jgi:hypothetical protein